MPRSPRATEPAIPDALMIRENTPEELDLLVPMEWAAAEIGLATGRHPGAADALFHSFNLLEPPDSTRMGTEFVHRAHCRELLDRVAAGADTRPATAAEICCHLCRLGAIMEPLTTPQVGVHVRMGAAAFPHQPDLQAELERYETQHGAALDDAERLIRHQLVAPWRVFGQFRCDGRHDNVPVRCQYATGDRSPRSAEG